MNSIRLGALPFLAILLLQATQVSSQESKRHYFELQTYTLANAEQEQRMDDYLKDAYLPALHRLGITNIGVFKTIPDPYVLSNTIRVLIPYDNLDRMTVVTDALRKDEKYLKEGSEVLDAAHDNPAYARRSSTVMRAFQDMPHLRPSGVSGKREDRVYELRSYEASTENKYWNKVAMFNAGGEVSLFESLGFNAVFYGEVVAGPQMPNLMYMTSFQSREVRDTLWTSFFSSEKWKSLKADPNYQNNVSAVDIFFLYPTAYSDY